MGDERPSPATAAPLTPSHLPRRASASVQFHLAPHIPSGFVHLSCASTNLSCCLVTHSFILLFVRPAGQYSDPIPCTPNRQDQSNYLSCDAPTAATPLKQLTTLIYLFPHEHRHEHERRVFFNRDSFSITDTFTESPSHPRHRQSPILFRYLHHLERLFLFQCLVRFPS